MAAMLARSLERGRARVLHLAGPDPQRRRRHARAVARRVTVRARGPVHGAVGTSRAPLSSSSCRAVSTGSARTRSTSWRRCRCWPTGPPTGTSSASRPLNPDGLEHQLEASTRAAERGATVVALTLPHTMKIRSVVRPRHHPRQPAGMARDVRPARARAHQGACPIRPSAARLDAGAKSKEAGIIGALARWENLVIDETFAAAERRLRGALRGRRRQGDGQGPLRRPARRRRRRPAPHRAAPAHRRVRSGLGAAGQGLAGPAHRGGRVRRRGASRHDVRGHLLHLDARRRRAGRGNCCRGRRRSDS